VAWPPRRSQLIVRWLMIPGSSSFATVLCYGTWCTMLSPIFLYFPPSLKYPLLYYLQIPYIITPCPAPTLETSFWILFQIFFKFLVLVWMVKVVYQGPCHCCAVFSLIYFCLWFQSFWYHHASILFHSVGREGMAFIDSFVGIILM